MCKKKNEDPLQKTSRLVWQSLVQTQHALVNTRLEAHISCKQPATFATSSN